MVIKESAEMYLETILILSQYGPVRSIDIANKTGFSRPTISEQMKKFRQNGLIEMDQSNLISLTEKGRKIAESTYEKHKVLTDMLMRMGVDESTAAIDACRMEHYISEISFEKIKSFLKEHFKA